MSAAPPTTARAERAPAEAAPAEASSPRRAADRLVALAAGLALLAALGLAFSLAWHRAYQVDEVESVHAAYAIATGKLIYRDFWQGHHPLLYGLLAPILPVDEPVAAFRIARVVGFALLLATVALSGWLTRRLGGCAWLAMMLLLLQSTFVERGMEVRPDTLMTPLLLLALVVGTFEDTPRLRRNALQGLLLGLAFLATQKAAIAAFAFGCVWLGQAISARSPRLVLVPSLVWLMPFAGMLGVLAALGGLEAFLEYNLFHPGESLRGQGAAASARFSALGPLVVEGSRNLAFVLAAVTSLVLLGIRFLRGEHRRVWPTAWLAVVWLAGLFVMPFPYPYSQVGGLPPLAVAIAVALPIGIERFAARPRRLSAIRAVALLLVVLATATALPRLLRELGRTNTPQHHLLERVHALTDESDRVLDLAGLYFRADAYPIYVMTGAHFARYQRGDYPALAPWLREHGLDLFVVNYRMKWLTGADREFLQTNFVRVEPNVFLSGRDLDGLAIGETRQLEVTRAGLYRFDGEGVLLVDGEPFVEGSLPRGLHALTSPTAIARGRLVSSRAPAYDAAPMTDVPVFYGFD
ncbi:MAG: hypothetical protein IPK00_19360 [Deltaproteobacteria bacterium]|nr:hypothetical protein [Deltaproteobacteria bacterium]